MWLFAKWRKTDSFHTKGIVIWKKVYIFSVKFYMTMRKCLTYPVHILQALFHVVKDSSFSLSTILTKNLKQTLNKVPARNDN